MHDKVRLGAMDPVLAVNPTQRAPASTVCPTPVDAAARGATKVAVAKAAEAADMVAAPVVAVVMAAAVGAVDAPSDAKATFQAAGLRPEGPPAVL